MTEVIEQTENKKGYKKTKLGWIPEDWEVAKLFELFNFTAGGDVNKTIFSRNKTKTHCYPIYSNSIEKKGLYGYSSKYTIDQEAITITGRGDIGRVFFHEPFFTPIGRLVTAIAKKNIDTKALSFFITQIKFRNESTGVPQLTVPQVQKYSIAYPTSKNEQEKIAEILSVWDDGIEAFEKLIEQKEIFHKALMKNLLIGKIRLSGYNSKWTHSKFNSIFERITRKNEELNSNILTISAQNGLISQKDFYNKRIASVDTSKYILLNNGEFAYNKSYSNGYPLGAIKRLDLYEKGVVSSLYICFKLNNSDNCSDFWKYYFEAGMLNREIKMIAQEGARNHGLLNMATEDFFNMLLYHPKDSKEQQKIAEILNKSDKEIQLLNSKLEKLKEQKKGLMQKLLTGQIRVKV